MSINNNLRSLPLPGTYFTNTTASGVQSGTAGNRWVGVDDFDKIGCMTGQTSKPYESFGSIDEAKDNGNLALTGITELAALTKAEPS